MKLKKKYVKEQSTCNYDEYEKLSDKVKNLTLSHNRMRKLLKMTLVLLETVPCTLIVPDMQYIHKRITLELYGLENYKELKGGKKCV